MKDGNVEIISSVTLVPSGSLVAGNFTSKFSFSAPVISIFAGSMNGEKTGG
jgi:hypothetical protein